MKNYVPFVFFTSASYSRTQSAEDDATACSRYDYLGSLTAF